MPLSLLNGCIALKDIQSFSGNEKIKQGKIVMIAAGVTGVIVDNVVFYPADAGMEVRYNGQEYVLVEYGHVKGKL